MGFELIGGEVLRLQAEVFVVGSAVDALVGEVVDGEDTGSTTEDGVVPVPDFQVGGSESSVPVMDMDDVGFESYVFRKLEPGAGQESEATGVIEIVVEEGIVVKSPAGEIFLDFDEINWESRGVAALDGAPLFGVAHPDTEGGKEGLEGIATTVDGRIAWHDNDDFMSEVVEEAGEDANNVGKAASLGEGGALGRDHEDFEGVGACGASLLRN